VSDKEGIIPFAKHLVQMGVVLLATGGTYDLLRREGVAVMEVSDYTQFPEMLGGRVKTLHPKIHGGILGRRDLPLHQAEMAQAGIEPIDLVVVNLYPFKETIAKQNVTREEAIEDIDVGGHTLLRAAAKNYRDVAAIVDVADYLDIVEEMKKNKGGTSEAMRYHLAQKVFAYTSAYDQAILAYLTGEAEKMEKFPERFSLHLKKVKNLRYGENPHQEATLYETSWQGVTTEIRLTHSMSGKEMSYNNYVDADSAVQLIREFQRPAAVIVKHNNPCGVATGDTLANAFCKARASDSTSAFGGVIAFNRPLDVHTASEIFGMFVEVVIAPEISPDAMELLSKKRDLRILQRTTSPPPVPGQQIRSVMGGILIQDVDVLDEDPKSWKQVSERVPDSEELDAMCFAWKVCKHLKSNAIVLASSDRTVGIGAGQMSRIDSVKLAITKANQPLAGCVMASDAFFPFRDGVDIAAQSGVRAVVQPGGSIRDTEVIQSANEHKMAMLFTSVRHFSH